MKKDSMLLRMKECGTRRASKDYSLGKNNNLARKMRLNVTDIKGRVKNPKYYSWGSGGNPWCSNALNNYLKSRVGDVWNDVYSDLVKQVRGMGNFYRMTLDDYLTSLIYFEVEIKEDGTVLGKDRWGSLRSDFNHLYVYPKAIKGGLLLYWNPEKKERESQPITHFSLDGFEYEFRYGCWYILLGEEWQALNKKQMEDLYKLSDNLKKHYDT